MTHKPEVESNAMYIKYLSDGYSGEIAPIISMKT